MNFEAFERLDQATTQAIIEKVDFRAFKVAMSLRKQVYEYEKNLLNNESYDIFVGDGEQWKDEKALFEFVLSMDDKSWDKHTDFENEILSGTVFKQQVDGFPVNWTKKVVRYFN